VKTRYLLALALVSALALAPSWAQQNALIHLKSKLAQARHLPFSSGVLAGNTLYIAGTTGVDPTTKGAVTAEEEARLVMDRVKEVVEQAGMTMDDVVSLQVFCTDLENYDAFNGL